MAPKKPTPSPAAAPPSANRSQHTSASATPSKPSASHSKTQTPPSSTTSNSTSTTAPKLAQQINALTNTKTATALSKSAPRSVQEAQQILAEMWNSYVDKTAQRVKLLDTFMGFLVLVGVLQFVYCVIVGNYVGLSTTLHLPEGREEEGGRERGGMGESVDMCTC